MEVTLHQLCNDLVYTALLTRCEDTTFYETSEEVGFEFGKGPTCLNQCSLRRE